MKALNYQFQYIARHTKNTTYSSLVFNVFIHQSITFIMSQIKGLQHNEIMKEKKIKAFGTTRKKKSINCIVYLYRVDVRSFHKNWRMPKLLSVEGKNVLIYQRFQSGELSSAVMARGCTY